MTEEQIVTNFITDKGFQKMAEEEIGTPVKCTVDWDARKVILKGPKSGRELDIDLIIQTWHGVKEQ